MENNNPSKQIPQRPLPEPAVIKERERRCKWVLFLTTSQLQSTVDEIYNTLVKPGVRKSVFMEHLTTCIWGFADYISLYLWHYDVWWVQVLLCDLSTADGRHMYITHADWDGFPRVTEPDPRVSVSLWQPAGSSYILLAPVAAGAEVQRWALNWNNRLLSPQPCKSQQWGEPSEKDNRVWIDLWGFRGP